MDARRPSTPWRTRTAAPWNAASVTSSRHRALDIRYDKLAVRYQATIHIARIDHWLKGHT